MIKCQICSKWFKTKRGLNVHIRQLHKNSVKPKETIIQKPSVQNSDLDFLKLEINMLKRQIRELRTIGITKTIIHKSSNSNNEYWNIKKENKPIELTTIERRNFGNVVKELNGIFNTDKFDYHNVLKPILPNCEPIKPPTK